MENICIPILKCVFFFLHLRILYVLRQNLFVRIFFYVFLVPYPVFIRIFSIMKTYHPVNVKTVKHPIKVIIWFCICRCAVCAFHRYQPKQFNDYETIVNIYSR